MDKFEVKIVKFFNNIGGKKLDSFLGFVNSIRFLSFFWTALVFMAIAVHPEIAWLFSVTVFFVALLHFGITEGLIKHFLIRFFPKRKRPYIKFPKLIRPIGKKFSDSSFPSSHMTTTVGMLVAIVFFYPSLLIPAVLLVLIMAFSRLHNGMHYPSDIVAGTLLGFVYGLVAIFLTNRIF
jgi:undecaprenyl-diphosphatase